MTDKRDNEEMMERFLRGRAPFMWVSTACFSALAVAYGLEFFLDMKPCVLCLYGRYVLMGLGAFSLFIYFFPSLQRLGLILLCVGFVGNASFVFYHLLVEHKIVEGPQTCRVTNKATTVEEFLAQAKTMTVVPCDKPQGNLFGLSITTHSFLFALLLGGYTALCLWMRRRRQTHDIPRPSW